MYCFPASSSPSLPSHGTKIWYDEYRLIVSKSKLLSQNENWLIQHITTQTYNTYKKLQDNHWRHIRPEKTTTDGMDAPNQRGDWYVYSNEWNTSISDSIITESTHTLMATLIGTAASFPFNIKTWIENEKYCSYWSPGIFPFPEKHLPRLLRILDIQGE